MKKMLFWRLFIVLSLGVVFFFFSSTQRGNPLKRENELPETVPPARDSRLG